MSSSSLHQPTDLEKMAETNFGPLSVSERRLLRAAPKGRTAYCGSSEQDDDPNNDPTHSDRWPPERDIRAELLRWLCVDREAINRVDPRGIQAHAAKITGKLDLSFVYVPFSLRLANCSFSEDVNLHFVEILAIELTRSLLPSLHASYAKVKGTMNLQGLQANGVVRLYGARIEGNLECNRGTLRNPAKAEADESGTALHAENAKVAGHVFLKEGFVAEGEVRLFAAEIGGNLECDNGKFQNPGENRIALNAENAKVGGNVHLRNKFGSEGEVRFFGTDIGGNLECADGEFRCPSQGAERIALNAEGATVAGGACFKEFSARGKVRLYHAKIARNLECKSARFESLDLTHASAAAILDDEKSWPEKGKLSLDGFTYGRISAGPATAEERLKWLARHDPFSRHPYRQLARVLREAGDDYGWRCVCAEMERRMWERRGWLFRPYSYLLWATVGYGYFSLRAFWWLAVVIVLGSVVYHQGYLAGSMVPTDRDAYVSFIAKNIVPGQYQAFHATAYSFENSFPLVKLGVQDKWGPGLGAQGTSRSPRWWTSSRFLLWFRWGQVCAGWLLATLFVAGVTGLIRRD